MNQEEFKVIYYQKENGRKPFEEFLLAQEDRTQYRILSSVDVLRIEGNNASLPLSKKLDKHIYELRILERNNYFRVLYFFYINKTIVITNAFNKKKNKTPIVEIERANIYRNDWLRRYGNEKRKD